MSQSREHQLWRDAFRRFDEKRGIKRLNIREAHAARETSAVHQARAAARERAKALHS